MILLSPEEVDYQIDYILDHNDLPLEALLKPLVESTSKAQAKKILEWLTYNLLYATYKEDTCEKKEVSNE